MQEVLQHYIYNLKHLDMKETTFMFLCKLNTKVLKKQQVNLLVGWLCSKLTVENVRTS